MNLAVAILLFSISSVAPKTYGSFALPLLRQQAVATQSPGPTPRQEPITPETQKPVDQQPAPPAPTAKHKTSAHKPATRNKPGHVKPAQNKVTSSGCDSPITPVPEQGSTAAQSPASPQASSSTPANPNPPTPGNCPPEKIVVRQGGTAEASIQLAGGDQASQKRNDATHMLGSTEENLKKISATQLSPEQQDTVSQIKQFVDQSKAALAAGDLERGHTLAWKAQLLSEDLIKPQK